MVYVHNLEPVIFSLGPLAIRWYSLVYIVGFILGWIVLHKYSDLTEKESEDFIGWLILGTVLGARLFYVLVYNPAQYLSQPLEILYVWRGGLSFHGGILGAAIFGWWWAKRHGKSILKLADLLVLPLSLMLVFGRLANFVNAELIGTVTASSWCVQYPGEEVCRHFSQLYAAAKNLLVFAILVPVYVKKHEEWREGTFLWLFVILYGLGRFITDFWRQPDLAANGQPLVPLLLNIQIGQWLSLIMVVVGILMLVRKPSGKVKKSNS